MATGGAQPASRQRAIWAELLQQAIAVGGLIISLRLALKYLDPYKEQREQSKKRAAFIKEKLGRNVELNEYEQLLATNVVNPSSIDISLEDVSGLEEIKKELDIRIFKPMDEKYSFMLEKTTLWRQARGVLLYGPPGTGKTMLAKALAKESNCFFLNITASSIMSKWLGDANKLVRAVFSLAEKLQPCIIFIDEVDAMLCKRGQGSEHEAMLQVKTEFMQLWDGMESCHCQRVVVMGATNRPWMVDEAVLRRFTMQFEIGLPDARQRATIIRGYLRRHASEVGERLVDPQLLNNLPVDATLSPVVPPPGAIDWLANRTPGFSGSDLMELCSQAAQRVLGDYWTDKGPDGADSGGSLRLRPVVMNDFVLALRHMRPATSKAEEYRTSGLLGGGDDGLDGPSGGGAGVRPEDTLAFLLKLLAAGGPGAPGSRPPAPAS